MTDQDKFEKWYASDLEEPLPTEFPIFGKNCLWMGWQAAKQDSAAEIAGLKKIIEKNKSTYFAMENLIEQLQAHDDEVKGKP